MDENKLTAIKYRANQTRIPTEQVEITKMIGQLREDLRIVLKEHAQSESRSRLYQRRSENVEATLKRLKLERGIR